MPFGFRRKEWKNSAKRLKSFSFRSRSRILKKSAFGPPLISCRTFEHFYPFLNTVRRRCKLQCSASKQASKQQAKQAPSSTLPPPSPQNARRRPSDHHNWIFRDAHYVCRPRQLIFSPSVLFVWCPLKNPLAARETATPRHTEHYIVVVVVRVST